MATSNLDIDAIRLDGGTQPRERLDDGVVGEYAIAMDNGDEFPPPVVFDDGAALWLADGFHRYSAKKINGNRTIKCEVRKGTQRDAILHSVQANATHGMRRTNADKRRAVMTLLEDVEWSKWSDSEVARRCAVSHTTVQRHRSSLAQSASEPAGHDSAALGAPGSPTDRTYTDRHGNTATMNTANIGKKASAETDVSIVDTGTGEVLEDAVVVKTKTTTPTQPVSIRDPRPVNVVLAAMTRLLDNPINNDTAQRLKELVAEAQSALSKGKH